MGRKTIMNKITSPEKTARINRNNIRLKDDFLLYLRSVQRSSGTIAGYDNDLLIVFTYILDELGNKDFQKLTKRDMISIQNWLLSNGNSSARIRRVKAAISSLSNYCENILADDDPEYEGYRSIIRKIESPALQPVREKTVFTPEQIEAALADLIAEQKYEVACFVALAAYGGRRKSEILRFRVDDFSDDKLVCGGSLWKSSPIKTKGRGNGKYLNCYTLVKKFRPYLELWLADRETNGIESEWLFPARGNREGHLTVSTVNSWMDSLSKATGLNWYSHALRHFYCSMLSNEGIPDNVIKEIIGWESIDMVGIYVDRSTEETLDKYFDENGIKATVKKDISEL